MHVPWGWIKQRPHFFAEYLAEDCIVDVFYKKSILVSHKKLLNSEDKKKNLAIRGFRQISFEKIPLIKYLKLDWINHIMLHWQLPDFSEYDYIWFTCPSMYQLFAHRLKPNNIIIYDCMDDILEFPFCKSNIFLAKRMLSVERELITKSDIIFCSSEYLRNKILNRSNCSRRVTILNNAIELPTSNLELLKLPDPIESKIRELKKYPYSLLYIGTISQWFDFKLLIKALEIFKDLHLMLIGPSDIKIPIHSRIHYLGTIERTYIFSFMKVAWCLIMPFQVNELIRSVNPVKLYEYIYIGKHIIAPKYEETIKFEKYVNLYNSENEFIDILKQKLQAMEPDESQKMDMRLFAQNNTWKNRYQIIRQELKL